ncbi:MAG: hypothetical protein GAK30_03117 [Paracidovorax wautersii]|uniref:Antitoxin n=1 Tax=Paracidovorax wautersii TaxID=1177982 RepID=A0A7V8FLV5_9BURK|nr:MAG: hypothetical protein GAK30_03117 [Paracidovorax wautersii]
MTLAAVSARAPARTAGLAAASAPSLAELPRHNASHVKNKWGEVVRQVHQSGSVAITNHAAIEMVLLDAATYQRLTDDLQALRAEREQAVLDALSARFDERLAQLQQPDAADRLDALFAAQGAIDQPPHAGETF